MFKDEILENESRRKIYVVIDANPGILDKPGITIGMEPMFKP